MMLNPQDRIKIEMMSTMFYNKIRFTYGGDFAEWLYKDIYNHSRDRYCIKKYGCTVDKMGYFG